MLLLWKFDRTTLSRGSKSRNKVSVGEPAEGSLTSYKEKAFIRGSESDLVDVVNSGVRVYPRMRTLDAKVRIRRRNICAKFRRLCCFRLEFSV